MQSTCRRLAQSIRLLGAILALALVLVSRSASAAEYTLQQVRDALTEELSSIHSLDVKYSFSFETNKPKVSPSYRNHWEWCIEGDKIVMFCDTPNDSASWNITAFDGLWTQLGLLTSLEPRQVKFLQRYRGEHPENLIQPDYPLSFGLKFLNEPGNLANLLDDPGAALTGKETVDGHECVRIVSGKMLPRAGNSVFRYTVWLDPTVRWLPRRLVCHFDPESKNYDRTTVNGKYAVLKDYRTLEFGWFPDTLLGRDRPFPTKVKGVDRLGRFALEVESLAVNLPIADDRFTVAPTFGTQMIEGEYQKDPRARRWLHGGEAAVAEDRRQRIEAARKLEEQSKQEIAALLEPKTSPSLAVDATPRTNALNIWWWLGCGSALALSVALFVWKRS